MVETVRFICCQAPCWRSMSHVDSTLSTRWEKSKVTRSKDNNVTHASIATCLLYDMSFFFTLCRIVLSALAERTSFIQLRPAWQPSVIRSCKRSPVACHPAYRSERCPDPRRECPGRRCVASDSQSADTLSERWSHQGAVRRYSPVRHHGLRGNRARPHPYKSSKLRCRSGCST